MEKGTVFGSKGRIMAEQLSLRGPTKPDHSHVFVHPHPGYADCRKRHKFLVCIDQECGEVYEVQYVGPSK